ncbi:cobalamin biosynthesis protein CobE [Pseudomonas cavernicola]|uniref:Cobalamin biosynthesis protein CobE n=1 Tax=Pseudomonas cavernicola TaxID=2320866 RepID=A0A418XJV6_9PSED|nr:cobalamin biosynthesis protein [Pseudomonas cavernicola]RJG12759.1 cobalamin biosynthesis protein CobE [Pseudomonas cavernicola]
MTVAPLYIAGLGCRRGCSEAVLRELLEQTLPAYGLHLVDLSGLASIEQKRTEPGLLALAQTLGLPLEFFSAAQLAAFDSRLTQHSAIALRAIGSAGVAEACALAQVEALSGSRAELLISKHSNASASFALASVRRA